MDSFSQEWGVAPRNEEATQEVTKHTAQDLKIWWGRGRVLFADPLESSAALVPHRLHLFSGVPNKLGHQTLLRLL